MYFDNRQILLKQKKMIKAGEAFSFTLNTSTIGVEHPEQSRYKLRLRGDVGLPNPWKFEGGYPLLYRDIDDSLSKETYQDNFSLKISADMEPYSRRAFYKIQCPPSITPQFYVPKSDDTNWVFSFLAKTDGLRYGKNAKVGVMLERFLIKEGRDIRDISDAADETIFISIPEGTADWTEFSQSVPIDTTTAAVLITVIVEDAAGTVWFERPQYMNSQEINIVPQFTLTNQYHPFLNWMGENLSYKEWTDIQLVINGTEIPPKALFQRCHEGSENEILLPDHLLTAGENTITIRNVSDYFQPYPYEIVQIDLLWKPILPVRIVSCPFVATKGEPFALLLETNSPKTTVRVSFDSTILSAPKEVILDGAGLHALPFHAESFGSHLIITLEADGHTETATIERIVEKEFDNVLVGSGDAIYVHQDIQDMQEFLAWYLANHLGNYITFRPVYRWSGSKFCNEAMWKVIVRLCNELQLYYCHLVDGRELPGWNANPTKAMMTGDYYVGNQGHERDGACYYWRQRRDHSNEKLYQDIAYRRQEHPDFKYSTPPIYTNDAMYIHFDPVAPKTMKDAAAQFIQQNEKALHGIKRHSGPSVLFKYFFEAGVEVGLAELMYGPHEVILSALRGASKAYDRKEFGGHLAVQWSTTPHDTPQRYRRFQLALFVCYLQGVHHINTEEGIYRIEEYFAMLDRFDEPNLQHGRVQRDFTKFVMTHTRRGEMVVPIALAHGANDAWVCFTRGNAWAHEGKDWAFNTPEESWDLLKIFYPDSVLAAIYRHPCPNSPQGFYSRTPYSAVDIVPIEAPAAVLEGYRYMAFLGYNTADVQQIETLTSFVENGGTLLLSWRHLATDVERDAILYNEPTILEASGLVGASVSGFKEMTNGLSVGLVSLQGATVLKEVDDEPLVLCHQLGKGQVILVNTKEYPANPLIRPIYEELLHDLGQRAVTEQKETGWITTLGSTVETAVYDTPEARIIYAINTDWWSDEETTSAVLHLQGAEYPVTIQREYINIFTIKNGIAVQTFDNETDVIDILPTTNGFTLTIQGYGTTTLRILSQETYLGDTEKVTSQQKGSYVLPLQGIEKISFVKK